MDIKETNPGANSPKQQPTAPLGDRGGDKTWEPPAGEQGISNREGDEEENHENREPKKTRN
jgi:hypothetical protein